MASRICVFASGEGGNTEVLIRYFQKNKAASVVLVATNNPNAFVLSRANRLGVQSFVFNKKELTSSSVVFDKLVSFGVDFIVLAGFLLRVPRLIVEGFSNRIINLHPSLLPDFGGKGMFGNRVHEAVLCSNKKESGITIHRVNEEYDDGDILFQAKCSIDKTETVESLSKKIKNLEHKHLPLLVHDLINNL